MTRLIDKALRESKWTIPPWFNGQLPEIKPIVTSFRSMLDDAEVIVADNVSEYLYAETDQEDWDKADFPCIAPPFETFWIEWRKPSRVISEKHGEVPVKDTVAEETGWLFHTRELDDNAGWQMRGMPLMLWTDFEFAGRRPFFPAMWVDIFVNPDGTVNDWAPATLTPNGTEIRDEKLQSWSTAMSAMSHVALLTLCFLNCKNVAVEHVDPPPKLSKKHQKRKGAPLRQYKTLRIDPMRKVLRSEGGAETQGLARALHVCRGHFSTYTEERPLFGRHVGTWWWGPHVRGSVEQGEIVKRYDVKAQRG